MTCPDCGRPTTGPNLCGAGISEATSLACAGLAVTRLKIANEKLRDDYLSLLDAVCQCSTDVRQTIERLATAERERDEARAALREYGSCLMTCRQNQGPWRHSDTCTCGYDALAALSSPAVTAEGKKLGEEVAAPILDALGDSDLVGLRAEMLGCEGNDTGRETQRWARRVRAAIEKLQRRRAAHPKTSEGA